MDRCGQASELSVGIHGEKVDIGGLVRTPENRGLAEREGFTDIFYRIDIAA